MVLEMHGVCVITFRVRLLLADDDGSSLMDRCAFVFQGIPRHTALSKMR